MSQPAGRSDAFLLLAVAVATGMGSIVHEVLYLRLLTAFLGDLFYVHAALLATFLVGIGIGALLSRRVGGHLWLVEVVLGGYALAMPEIARAYQASPLEHAVSHPLASAVLSSILLLLVPATCVGFSLPLFGAGLARLGTRRDSFAIAYALYNLGAFASILLVDYWLIHAVGYRRALCAVGALDVACGGILWWKRQAWFPEPEPPASQPWPVRQLAALLLASAACGVFQALYLKLTYAVFGPHRENFALCTGTLLLAIAVGSLWAAWQRPDFARCLGLGALTVGLSVALLPVLATAYRQLPATAASLGGRLGALLASGSGMVVAKLVFAFLIGGTGYAFLSATIPSLLREQAALAHQAGRLLFVSGLGNAVGLLLYMFLLHPYLRLFTVAVVVMAVLFLALLIAGSSVRQSGWMLVCGGVLAAIVWRIPEASAYTGFELNLATTQVLTFKSGPDDASLVSRNPDVWIHYNGQPEVLVTSAGQVNRAEVVSGVLAAMLAPRRGRAVVLGLGTGITSGTVATLFEHTDVAEINGAFFPLAERIAAVNFGLLRNIRASVFHQDGRRFLAQTKDRYDAVVNSIPAPTFFTAGKIYTAEFYDLVKRSLLPDGIYCSWLDRDSMSAPGVQILLATLASRFQHCNLASLRGAYYFTACADHPLPSPAAGFPFPPALVAELKPGIPYATLDEYFSAVVVSSDILGGVDSGVPLNHDDFPVLEFQMMADRSVTSRVRPDPFLVDPERYGLALPADLPDELLLQRAIVLSQVHPRLFNRLYLDRIAADRQLLKAFQVGAVHPVSGEQRP